MCAATRRKGTSIRRWNWRSTTRPTASAWRLTPSTAFPNFSRSAGMPRRNSATGRSHAGTTLTSTASTPRDYWMEVAVRVGLSFRRARVKVAGASYKTAT